MALRNQLFLAGVVLCGVALGGCSGSTSGPVQPTGVGPAAKLVFTAQPSNAVAGAANSPATQVAVQDAQGNTVTTATISITLAIGTNPGRGALAGTRTVAAVNGVATFANVSINNAGTGYTLTASAASLTGATSGGFNITAPTIARTWATVSAGGFFACGATTAGAAYCWGANVLGQLGNGTTIASPVPVVVSGGLNFVAVNAGYYQTCGVTTDGAAYCWGSNVYGELGNGTNVGPQQCSGAACSTTPVAVAGGLTFATVSAGHGNGEACGVTTGGIAYCWGFGVDGTAPCGATAGAVPG